MKKNLGPVNSLYPSLTVLVGAYVNGKPNFITIAHVGIMTLSQISVGINKAHYTNEGIKENGTFSVNIPSRDLVEKTDYVGLVSGRKTDKAELFDLFYGELGTAPMIRQCPVCMECKVERIVDFPRHDVFVGDIVATYADESVLESNTVDIGKVNPILFGMGGRAYWALGERIAGAWDVGKRLQKKE